MRGITEEKPMIRSISKSRQFFYNESEDSFRENKKYYMREVFIWNLI